MKKICNKILKTTVKNARNASKKPLKKPLQGAYARAK